MSILKDIVHIGISIAIGIARVGGDITGTVVWVVVLL